MIFCSSTPSSIPQKLYAPPCNFSSTALQKNDRGKGQPAISHGKVRVGGYSGFGACGETGGCLPRETHEMFHRGEAAEQKIKSETFAYQKNYNWRAKYICHKGRRKDFFSTIFNFINYFYTKIIQKMNNTNNTKKNFIILIGNGFDLAQGLKTSYSDFADYFIDLLTTYLINKNGNLNDYYDDEILKKSFLTKYMEKRESNERSDIYYYIANTDITDSRKKIIEFIRKDDYNLTKDMFKNSFLSKLYRNGYKNWFDIENAYFIELKKIVKSGITNKSVIKDRVIKLNNELEDIKIRLIEYLNKIDCKNKSCHSVLSFFNKNSKEYDSIYTINFNYTCTAEKYISNIVKFKPINYIHGKINNNSDQIIFGYGNDLNVDYSKMKDTGIDEFLTHFKTYEYIKYPHYSEILNVLNYYKNYDVYVLGHSLGLTDKTLLSEIIDTDKCNKLYIFKRADLKGKETELKNSFMKIAYATGRIIEKESDLRKKIVNYEKAVFFPLDN